ncbi:MAG: hypothetical protein GY788_23425 [bacterium]|nr:hypothetical protein [bacterium]
MNTTNATTGLTDTSEHFLNEVGRDWTTIATSFLTLIKEARRATVSDTFLTGQTGWVEILLRSPAERYSPLFEITARHEGGDLRVDVARASMTIYFDGPDLGQAWARTHLFACEINRDADLAGMFYTSATEVNEAVAESEL